jgi:DNA-3-methyladenine glycosylase
MADQHMVPLGFGKYARADRIYALEPITGSERGSGRGRPGADRRLAHAGDDPGGDGPRARRHGTAAPVAQRSSGSTALRRVTFREIVASSVHDAAPALLGWTLLVAGVGGRIVEVEAYEETDPASHSHGGPRGRNTIMFGPPGRLYVHRSYGIHWCANVVCEGVGRGAAVLLRAIEPTHGLERMRVRRGVGEPRLLCSGPGRLTQALGLSHEHNGAALDRPPFAWLPPDADVAVAATPRIGITKATEQPWRYVIRESPWLSRAPRRA